MSKSACLLFPLTLGLLAQAATAQVPSGWGAFTRLEFPPLQSTEGITVFSPFEGISLGAKAQVDITGLPSFAAGYGPFFGWNCLLIDDRDGSIVAAPLDTSGDPNNSYEFFHFTLSGDPFSGISVASTRSFSLGNGGVPNNFGGSGVNQMARLPGDRILFDHLGVTGPAGMPLPVTGVAILDFVSGAITPLPLQLPTAPGGGTYIINALTVDPTGTEGYVGLVATGGTVVNRTVWKFTVPPAGGPVPPSIPLTPVGASFPNGIYVLDTDSTGLIYVATFTGGLWTLDPVTGTQTQLNTVPQMNGMYVDPVSDDVLFVENQLSSPSLLFRRDATTGAEVSIGPIPPNVAFTGIAIRSSMLVAGAQSSCGAVGSYDWQVAPNPGGSPLVGNQGFSLSLDGAANPVASLVVMATAPAAAPVPLPNCTTLLVAPSPASAPFVGSMRYPTYALPLPADPALCERTFYFQSFHVERRGNFASSPRLSVRLQ